MTRQASTGGEMLIAAPERWDEACFAAPAVRAMLATGVGVGVLCAADQRGFWETLTGLTVVDFPVKTKARTLAATLGGNWQAALLWEPGLAAEACARAKIPRRLGPAEKPLKKFLTHPVPLAAADRPLEHRVRHYLAILETMGLDTGRAEFFAAVDLGGPRQAQSLLLCPDSDFGRTYEWPVERWVELGQALLANGWALTLAGLPSGNRAGARLLEKLGGELPFFKIDSLAGLLPVLATQAVVLAADGSLPHLAAHVGATCVTLFGPNDPAWKRPLGVMHAVVHRHVACAPCFLTKCPLDSRCQNELTVERVLAAVNLSAASRDRP
ncbi:MAG: glycosyltransferase family 9 protein [Verrucomicrobiota bacterium]